MAVDNNNSINRSSKFNINGNFLSIIIGLIILACIIRALNGSTKFPTFSSFLQTLSSAPTIKIPFLSKVVTNLGDWGILNFLRDFIQAFLSLFDVLIFLLNGALNLMSYVVYFMRWIFVV